MDNPIFFFSQLFFLLNIQPRCRLCFLYFLLWFNAIFNVYVKKRLTISLWTKKKKKKPNFSSLCQVELLYLFFSARNHDNLDSEFHGFGFRKQLGFGASCSRINWVDPISSNLQLDFIQQDILKHKDLKVVGVVLKQHHTQEAMRHKVMLNALHSLTRHYSSMTHNPKLLQLQL